MPDSSDDSKISEEISQAISLYEEAQKEGKIETKFEAEISSISNGGLVSVTFNEETQLNFKGSLEEAAPVDFNVFIEGEPKFSWTASLVG